MKTCWLNEKKVVLSIAAFAMILSSAARASVVDFEDQAGPSLFADAGPAQTLVYNFGPLSVTFEHGVILDETSNLPANQTSIYGTAFFGDVTLLNPLTITFSSPVTNVFFDLYNGLTSNIDYLISDNDGHSANFTLAPNLSSGTTLVGFAATGTVITIASVTVPTTTFDFFIDNIHFNEALPPSLIPEPEIYAMMLAGLGLMGFVARRRKQSAAAV